MHSWIFHIEVEKKKKKVQAAAAVSKQQKQLNFLSAPQNMIKD